MSKYLLDTNALIYYFNGIIEDIKFTEIIEKSFQISIITEMEFLGWKGFINKPEEFLQAQEFIKYANVLNIDKDIVRKTVKYRQSKAVKLPDCIIAATAFVHDLTIVTCNTCDFEKLRVSYYVPLLK